MKKETEKILSDIEALANEGKGESDELESLRREKALRENLSRELEELMTLFPETDVDEIPDEVWEACPDGKGVCAQYALYLKRQEMKKTVADKKNDENVKSAVPNVKTGEEEAFFTPEQVEKMSRAEVDANWQTILKSMKNWKYLTAASFF